MKSSLSSSTRSFISTTSENVEIPRCKRFAMIGMFIVLVITSFSIVAVSLISLMKCNETYFAGWTPIIGFMLLVFSIIMSITAHSGMRVSTLALCLFTVAASAALLIYEAITLYCFSDHGNFCTQFVTHANLCGKNNPTKITKPVVERKIGLIVLNVANLISSGVLLVLYSFTLKVGQPVFLGKKRHHNSIVVGLWSSVLTAEKNKNRNVRHAAPKDEEKYLYQLKQRAIIKLFNSNWSRENFESDQRLFDDKLDEIGGGNKQNDATGGLTIRALNNNIADGNTRRSKDEVQQKSEEISVRTDSSP